MQKCRQPPSSEDAHSLPPTSLQERMTPQPPASTSVTAVVILSVEGILRAERGTASGRAASRRNAPMVDTAALDSLQALRRAVEGSTSGEMCLIIALPSGSDGRVPVESALSEFNVNFVELQSASPTHAPNANATASTSGSMSVVAGSGGCCLTESSSVFDVSRFIHRSFEAAIGPWVVLERSATRPRPHHEVSAGAAAWSSSSTEWMAMRMAQRHVVAVDPRVGLSRVDAAAAIELLQGQVSHPLLLPGATECGVVRRYNPTRGFGFITASSGGLDIFVHHSGIASGGFRALNIGSEVVFCVGVETQDETQKGRLKAVEVVQSSPYRPTLTDARRRGEFNAVQPQLGGDTCGDGGAMARAVQTSAGRLAWLCPDGTMYFRPPPMYVLAMQNPFAPQLQYY